MKMMVMKEDTKYEATAETRNETDARLLSVLLGSVRIICGVYS